MQKTILSFLIIFVFQSISSLAQTTDEEQLSKAIEQLKRIMVNPDAAELANIASDDLEYVHSSGTYRDKQGFIDEFMKGWTIITKVKTTDQTIRVTGNNAIIRHRMVAHTNKPGQPEFYDIIILMVWRKEEGQWKLLARQAAKTY